MNIPIGSLVKATAGRDKDSYFVAVGEDGGFVYIADGRERKLEKPKRKNPKHISPVGYVTEVGGLTNRKIRRLINEYLTHTDLQQTKNL